MTRPAAILGRRAGVRLIREQMTTHRCGADVSLVGGAHVWRWFAVCL
jgi:hypothetical protein